MSAEPLPSEEPEATPPAAGPVADPAAPPLRVDVADPLVSLVERAFKTKGHRKICLDELAAAIDGGRFVWIDIDIAQRDEARALLARLQLCVPEIVEDAMTREPATQLARYDDYVHLVLSGCRLVSHKFDLERVDAIIGEGFLLTLHKGQPVFLEAVRN